MPSGLGLKSNNMSANVLPQNTKTEPMTRPEDEDLRKKLLSQPVYVYCCYMAGCFYDKAREIIDKERDAYKNVASQLPNHVFYSVLSQLCGVEKLYMSIGYLAPKRLFLKETSLSIQYTHLYNEISRLDEKLLSKDLTIDAEIMTLSTQIKNFIRARIALVDFYEKISLSAAKAIQASLVQSPVHAGNQSPTASEPDKHTSIQIETIFLPCIREIHQLYNSCLTSVVLDPLRKSFDCELDCTKSFLETLSLINKWKFYEAIQSLDFGRRAMLQWTEYVQNSAKGLDLQIMSSSKMSFFDSLRSLTSANIGSSAEQMEPALLDWLASLKGALHSKFTLYFYEVLLAQTTLSDMKEKCTKLAIDYPTKITTFQRRIEALAVGLIHDASVDQSTYKGPGFHHPDKKLPYPIQGLDLYPSPFISPTIGTNGTCIPQDEVARHWCYIVKILNDFSKELDIPDRIVYVFDQKLDTSYYLMKIDSQMTMFLLFERAKGERDPQITSFYQEISSQLRCNKVFASLKPGYK